MNTPVNTIHNEHIRVQNQSHRLTFPIRGRSFNFSRQFRMCETAPQHFKLLATLSSLNIYSSSVSGKDLYQRSQKFGEDKENKKQAK